MTEHDLLAHLVASRLSGRVATATSNSLRNAERLVEGDPDCTMGLSDWRDAGYDEVLAAVHAVGGRELDPEAAHHPGGGYIEPEATLEGIMRHQLALAGFVAGGGGRVLVATGHPSLLRHYAAVAGALESAGCEMVRPLADTENGTIGYVEGVAVLTFDGREQHTHRSVYMEAMLDAIGRRDGVDLVVADHGYAGAAIAAGVPTLAVMDTNDPALAVVAGRGANLTVVPMDDNRPLNSYAAALEVLKGGT
jgi:hypothetical protein